MSSHGPKYTTAFNGLDSEAIRLQIAKLAMKHNNLIRKTDIDIGQWRRTILPPDQRELSLQVERHYGGRMYSSSYVCRIDLPKQRWQASSDSPLYEFGGSNASVVFGWLDNQVGRFPRWAGNSPKLHDDVCPKLVDQIHENIREWMVSATNYGLVRAVFNWINEFCDKGDRLHARSLLPGLVPLISKYDPALARRLAKPSSASRRPVPEEMLPGIQRANQIISEGLMLPDAPKQNAAVSMMLADVKQVSYSDWPQRFDPIVDI